MEIRGDHPDKPVNPAQQTDAAAHRPVRPGQVHTQATSADQVDLSPRAKEIQQAARVLAQTPDVRKAQVAEIKRAVEGGTYSVKADQLAGKMVKDALLDLIV